ncbi:tetratricopeptide repeat protein [Stigmatella hybrida]|uniref:tetratricopeptide repeat protein n=1 Tax=Stigmatella hybrida TaxID=394097 RepID=UPI001CDB133A|nr:tetratricopeptide repeat protein [Stigmatella hybrida]
MSTSRVLAFAATALLFATAPGRVHAQAADALPLKQVEEQLQNADSHIRFVETQFTQRPEPTDDGSHLRRFSDGEIQYLLGDWASASVLFYDLVSEPAFKRHPRYADALFYLSDALYQQQNFIGARLYLRQQLSLPPTERYKDGLSRYLSVASRLNQFEDIDSYIEQARQLSGGQLPPELAYVYAKWLFKRADLPPAERIRSARAAFEPLTQAPNELIPRQSAYHLGVLSVQAGEFADAIERFRAVTALPASSREERRIRELANLSMGRLLYESGRLDEALDRYQEIPRDSDYFVDTLYEIAWTQVKRGRFEPAKNAVDLLLQMAPESTRVPDAQLLQAHLLLKMRRYDEATESYHQVITAYRPVKDQLDELLTRTSDPVVYFDNLLSESSRTLELGTLLPPVALRYATTQQEISDASRLVGDLAKGQQGVTEARALATRVLDTLAKQGWEAFPELHEGYNRVDAVESGLIRMEQVLVQLEAAMVLEHLTPEERQQLEALRREREPVAERFALLPTTLEEKETRRQRMQARVDTLDREAFRLIYELQSQNAVTASVLKWLADSRDPKKPPSEAEIDVLGKIQIETDLQEELKAELARTRAQLSDERTRVASFVAGEETIRQQFYGVLQREHLLLASISSRLPEDVARQMAHVQEVRERADGLRARVAASKGVLLAQRERRVRIIQDKVRAEEALLTRYDAETATASADARNLVGRIAFDSFRRVRQHFYELVLKGDLGLVDVAFTRKQDKTEQIQALSVQKDEAVRALDKSLQDSLQDTGE